MPETAKTTMTDRETVRETLLMRFNRRGGPTAATADFQSFPAEQQQRILSSAQLAPQEMPVLLSCRDDHSWTLITTQRVLSKSGLSVDSLKGGEIEAILSPTNPAADPKRALLSTNGLPLAIRVSTSRGAILELPVEPNKAAYSAIHYVLTFILETARLKQSAAKPAPAPAAKKSWFK